MLTSGGVRNIRQYTDMKKQIIAGIPGEIADRIRAAGGTETSPSEGTHIRQEPEITKYVAQQMVREAGVKVLLHTYAAAAILEDSSLAGIVVENKSGRSAVKAPAVIDATGDGDIIFLSGAAYEKSDGVLQPMTLTFTICGASRWPEGLLPATRELIRSSIDDGSFPVKRSPGIFALPRRGEYYINGTRIPGDCTDVCDLTRAELEGRQQVMQIVEWLRLNAPGFENVSVQTTAPQVGLRESRRLCGEYQLTREDVLGCRDFHDNIARCAYYIDIHYPGKGGEATRLEPGSSYGIPFRCLIPAEMDGLLAAGRCLSATHDALGSARVMAPCMATGQAAGTAAAIALRQGLNVRSVNVRELRKSLEQQGAIT